MVRKMGEGDAERVCGMVLILSASLVIRYNYNKIRWSERMGGRGRMKESVLWHNIVSQFLIHDQMDWSVQNNWGDDLGSGKIWGLDLDMLPGIQRDLETECYFLIRCIKV